LDKHKINHRYHILLLVVKLQKWIDFIKDKPMIGIFTLKCEDKKNEKK